MTHDDAIKQPPKGIDWCLPCVDWYVWVILES